MPDENAQSKGNPETGYWLNFSPVPTDIVHEFCGVPQIKGAICENCNKPLLRILSLNAEDTRLGLDPIRQPVVHLLYCWTCSVPFGEFSYKVRSDCGVEVLHVPDREPDSEFGSDGPYDGYTGIFPLLKVSLVALAPQEQEKLRRRVENDVDGDLDGDLDSPRHQVGGYPLIYNPTKTVCPGCSAEMPVLAAICDSAVGNQPFGIEPQNSFAGNGGVQMLFQFCRNCSVVSAYHSCD